MADYIPPAGPSKHSAWDSRADGVTSPGSYAGWPKGMNNVMASESLAREFLRNAVNVDISDTGNVSLRSGRVMVIPAPTQQMHSLWSGGPFTLVVDGSTLYRVRDGALEAIRVGLTPGAQMVYLLVNGEVYFTNNSETGVVGADGVARAWGVPIPTPPAPGITSGDLVAGTYTACYTYSTAKEEGGASESVSINAIDGSGIVFTLPTSFPPEVTGVNLYVSGPNGTVEHRQGTYSTPGGTVIVSGVRQVGFECRQHFITPPMAGSALMYYRGCIYIANDCTVFRTEPLRYGAVKMSTAFFPFVSPIRLMAATKEQDGFYVSTAEEHHFFSGAATDMKVMLAAPYPAVPGTLVRDDLTDEPVWFTTKGWVTGKSAGNLEAKMALSVAVPEYEAGAAMYREENGLRQYVSSFAPPPEVNGFAAFDYIEAEVIRKGE